MSEQGTVRTFDSGATRDTDAGKLDYEGFLSPLVLERYAQYMYKHRRQSDGTVRASDNWKNGIPRLQYLKSLLRHVIDFWLLERHHTAAPDGSSNQDLACAIMFNVMGWLHETLIGRDAK